MNLYDFTKKYGEGKGESMMWTTVRAISDAVEADMPENAKKKLMRRLYGVMSSGHYDESFAKEDVSKMYYLDGDGVKHYAPFWTDPQIEEAYKSAAPSIDGAYNMWDFYVTLNMVKADNCRMLSEWFPGATSEEMNKKFVDMAVNWLNDPDYPYGETKIWSYLNRG